MLPIMVQKTKKGNIAKSITVVSDLSFYAFSQMNLLSRLIFYSSSCCSASFYSGSLNAPLQACPMSCATRIANRVRLDTMTQRFMGFGHALYIEAPILLTYISPSF